MADVFGNLDNFLENYDENNLSSISTLSDAGGTITTDASDLDRSRRQSRSFAAKKNSSSKIAGKSQNNRNKKATTSAPVTSPTAGSGSTASTSMPVHSVDLSGTTLSSVAEEMQSLRILFLSIFNSKNPIVTEMLKGRDIGLIKRKFNTLDKSYNNKSPVTVNEVTKLKEKIDPLRISLNQLNERIKSVLQPVSTNPLPPSRSRQSRNTTRLNQMGAPIVISLDCDDDPPMMQTYTQSSNRRVTRRSRANETHNQSNVISLDSDDDSLSWDGQQVNSSIRANNSFESENYVMRIKVKWGGGIEMFDHRRFQKFADIIAALAAKESADGACIILNLGDRIVHSFDTPDSINYTSNQFISGRILRGKAPALPVAVAPSATNNNTITLKIQMETRKQPLRLQIDKHQPMSVLVIKCAEELQCAPTDIKLYFDGEKIDTGSKPEDLDLEGDEILDVRFAK